MVLFADSSLTPPREIGRIDLFDRDLGKYQNIIKKWIDKLEADVKEKPRNISQLKFGKILGYCLDQCLRQQTLRADNFTPLMDKNKIWEEPYHKDQRSDKGISVVKLAYRVYFNIPGINHASENEEINKKKVQAHIDYLTTITDDGLMVFSFEDKIEQISPKLFAELAKDIDVQSNSWSRLLHVLEENQENSPNLDKILGLILYANIIPEGGNQVFDNICSELAKSKNGELNSIVVGLLKDTIPEYERKAEEFIYKNYEPMSYNDEDLRARGVSLGLPSDKIDEISDEMKDRKSIEELTNKRANVTELKKTLIGAVDEYLRWRDNKSRGTDYQHASGYLTRLRHFTQFGKNRANDLRKEIDGAQDLNTVLTILQNHLSTDSRLNNHSLDSYLLRALYKDYKNFKPIFNFEHITVFNDSKTTRGWILDEVLKKEVNPEMNIVLEHSPVDRQDSQTLPDRAKIQINVMRIPTNEREENILAVYTVLNNDELLRNEDGSVPPLIREIRDLVGALDSSNVEGIASTILEIKRKISLNSHDNYNDNTQEIINTFAKPSCCDFKKIRAALSTNPAMDEIMNPVRIGRELN